MKKYSFKKGWGKVPLAFAKELKTEVCELLNIKSSAQWSRKLNGKSTLSLAEIQAIETTFKKYGITDIWD